MAHIPTIVFGALSHLVTDSGAGALL